MKKLFTSVNISYKFLIIFSIIVGLLVGIINRIPILNNTSFQDIAIYLDMWVILAIFIIFNCKNSKEAMFKCFIFFLISQPLIYFTEIIIDVLFNNNSFIDKFVLYFNNYYIHNGWLLLTILTIPGSYIAYQVKKDNIFSGIILSVATGFLMFSGINFLLNCIFYKFPYHLLTGLTSIIMSIYFIFILLNKKSNKIISLIITIICGLLSIICFLNISNKPIIANEIIDINNSNVTYNVDDEDIAILKIIDKELYVYSNKKIGETIITINDGNELKKYLVKSTSKNFTIKLIK